MSARATPQTQTLTTTEAAVLALLALEGERSGYDLLKRSERAIGLVWAPARTQLYALLPRLVRDGLAESRAVAQESRPDKRVYRITDPGREAFRVWHETVEPGATEAFYLRLFVGALTTHEVLTAHVEQFRADVQAELDRLRQVEPTNTRTGADYYHYFLLRFGIDRHQSTLDWCDWVLAELRAADAAT